MSKDFDKFAGFVTESVLKNWEKSVTDDIKNGLEEKKSSKEISMIDALENLGIELTSEEQEYFKDKVLTYVAVSDYNFSDITDHKLTVTVNYVKNNSGE